MLRKKILTFSLITAALAHAAANDALNTLALSGIIGYACSTRGTLACVTTLDPEDPFCSVTLVYSEHKALKADEKLGQVADVIDREKKFSDYEHFKKLCIDTTAAHVIPIRLEPASSVFSSGPSAQPLLIALCIKLSTAYIEDLGYFIDQEGRHDGGQGKKPLTQPKYNGLLPTRLTATQYIPNTSIEPLTGCPQAEADRLQEKYPEKPFHLVINLAKWRAAIEH